MTEESQETASPKRPRKLSSRVLMVVRRTHLYAGLFLLPWVFLFGITGAMFNHQGLFPEVSRETVPASAVADTSLNEFPEAAKLAAQVVDAIAAKADGSSVTLRPDHGAEFTGVMMFETWIDGERMVVRVDPISKSSQVVTHPANDHKPKPALQGVSNVSLNPKPMSSVQQAVPGILKASGVEPSGNVKPIGWTKLNFLADVDGEPARVTYVLKDGHVDITKFDGSHGLSPRRFFLRLHTTHVMSPYWNGRTFWVIAADAMAVAMVVWGISGLLMWWQIKRTRLVGGIVILASIATATWMFLSVGDFYATTKL